MSTHILHRRLTALLTSLAMFAVIATGGIGVSFGTESAVATPLADPAPGGAAPVGEVHAPNALETLRPLVGQEVTVEGIVELQGESKSGTVRYLNFSQNFRDAVALVFMLRKSGGEGFTKEKLAEYIGKKIRVTGKLAEYQGNLQIEVGSLEQLLIQP